MKFEIGKAYKDVPSDVYHDDPRMSNSKLNHLTTMAHYWDSIKNQKTTQAMEMGRILHSFIIENEKDFVVEPAGSNRRTKKYKEWKEEQILPIIKQDEFAMLNEIRSSISQHRLANFILDDPVYLQKELSVFFEIYGVECKSRYDILNKKNDTIYDLKFVSATLSEYNISKMIYNYGYYRQAALYSMSYAEVYGKYPRFVFIFVEKNSPHGIKLIELDKNYISIGRDEIEYRLNYYLKYKEQLNNPPAYKEIIHTIEAPGWL